MPFLSSLLNVSSECGKRDAKHLDNLGPRVTVVHGSQDMLAEILRVRFHQLAPEARQRHLSDQPWSEIEPGLIREMRKAGRHYAGSPAFFSVDPIWRPTMICCCPSKPGQLQRGVGKRCMKETLSRCSTQQCLPQIPTLDRFAMRRTNPGKLAFLDRKERAFQDRFVPGEKSGCGTQLVPGAGN